MDYDKDEQFFSKEDIPQRALQIKETVQTFVDPDILGLRKKEWNTSVSVPKNPLSEETHERKLVKIRLGLFDHPIPKEKANKIYEGIETRDNYLLAKKGSNKWNVSTETNNLEFYSWLQKIKNILFSNFFFSPFKLFKKQLQTQKQNQYKLKQINIIMYSNKRSYNIQKNVKQNSKK